MTPSHEKILHALRTHGELNCRQISQKAHVSLSTARQKATWKPLIEAGLVSERLEQRTRGAPWRFYSATDEGPNICGASSEHFGNNSEHLEYQESGE